MARAKAIDPAMPSRTSVNEGARHGLPVDIVQSPDVGERQNRIDGVERGRDFANEGGRARAWTSNRKRGAAASRTEIDRGRRGVYALSAHILGDTHNFEPGAGAVLPNPLTKRIGRPSPILASHVVRYQHDVAVAKNFLAR